MAPYKQTFLFHNASSGESGRRRRFSKMHGRAFLFMSSGEGGASACPTFLLAKKIGFFFTCFVSQHVQS